jgi:dynein heavy chain
MNTVLDDNMTLCLANGQRIKLRPQMRMLFEVADLAVASPATVSRCGMVYLTQEELGWRPFVKTWMATTFKTDYPLDDEMKLFMDETFESTIDLGIEKVRMRAGAEPITTDNLQLVRSMCNFLEILITHPTTRFLGDEKQKRKDLESLIAFSYTWGMGAALDEKGKDQFDT